MSTTTKWIIGIVAGLLVLFALPFAWQAIFTAYGYGMTGGYRHMSMMDGGYGYGFMPFFGFFMWLIPLGLVALIVLGIAALVKYLKDHPDVHKDDVTE